MASKKQVLSMELYIVSTFIVREQSWYKIEVLMLLQVEWSNGKMSWVKECDLPSGLQGKHCRNIVKAVDMVQFGKKIRMLVPNKSGEEAEDIVEK